jgi:hypothetical protein
MDPLTVSTLGFVIGYFVIRHSFVIGYLVIRHSFSSNRERAMSVTDHAAVYEDLLELLAESADEKRVLAFRLSDDKQARLDELLDKNREGTLNTDELAELKSFEHFEHVVRLLKARLLRKQTQ